MFWPWQPVTYGFLHGDPTHLLFNMLGLWMFGSELERVWGQKRYIQFLLASFLSSAAVQLVWSAFIGSRAPTVGISFGLYGLIRKLVAVDAVSGLGVEGVYLFLPALALLLWSETHGAGGFGGGYGIAADALLIFAGVLTALPLIGFAYAVRRAPLSVVGLMQYIAPTIQFLLGVLFFGEAFDRDRAAGFVFIWIALAIFAGEGLWRARRQAAIAAAA